MLNLNANRPKFIKDKKKIIFLTVLSLILVPFLWILADTPGFELQTAWPNSPAGRELNEESTITDLVAYFYEWGIALGGLVAFIALLIAGFLYLTSVGDPTKTNEAIDRIKSAFLGLILLLTSWLILYTINPQLTTFQQVMPIDIPAPNPGLPEEELYDPIQPCVKAIIFQNPDFTGREHLLEIKAYPAILDATLYPSIKSFVMCREKRDGEEEQPNDKCPNNLIEGGACTLQFFGPNGKHIHPPGCRGIPYVEISDPRHPDLSKIPIIGERRIGCVRLVDRTRNIQPIPATPTAP